MSALGALELPFEEPQSRQARHFGAEDGEPESGSCVELSERFFVEATEAPVPLDIRVLRALRSPFEIDLYVWLTWRFFRLRRPVTIPWESLMLQFGCGYSNPRHFRKRLLDYLRNVLLFYPEARLESRPAGLLLKPSPTHVPNASYRSDTGLQDGTANPVASGRSGPALEPFDRRSLSSQRGQWSGRAEAVAFSGPAILKSNPFALALITRNSPDRGSRHAGTTRT